MPYHSRHTPDLRKGRVSVPGATYFLSWVVQRRMPLFRDLSNREVAREQIVSIDGSGDGTIMAATVMPDHVHIFLELGSRLSLSEVVAKTKGCISRRCDGLHWQQNYFDHQLRVTDVAEDYAFYIFMNPYSAGVCSLDETWSGWIPSKTIRWSFEDKLRNGQFPQAAWLDQARAFAKNLPAGAD